MTSFSTRWASFNPRARRGRDGGYMQGSVVIIVSIHAPAGGATAATGTGQHPGEVSIHAPAGGATGDHRHQTHLVRVSIHAPAGGATQGGPRSSKDREVSIHAPAGGATLFHANQFWPYLFQSTRPQGARQDQIKANYHVELFQSTRPQGARPIHACCAALRWVFQSTRPQGARRHCDREDHRKKQVSIHAPAGGATVFPRYPKSRPGVSIHAPAGGATSRSGRGLHDDGFQSTRPQGARPRQGESDHRKHRVSIHAPAGGATQRTDPVDGVDGVSIHAPAGGATAQIGKLAALVLFQSTRPQGARPPWSASFRSARSFNPRARRGRDRLLAKTETAYRKTVFCANPCQLDHR